MRISIAATAACLSMAGPTLSNVASAAPSADSEPASTSYLEEIIVTAQKRDERLQDVPSSVTALSSQRMLESHQTQLVDYAATVPGLHVQNAGGPGRSSLTMRGLALGGSSATVGTYIDDMPIGSSGGSQNAVGFALDLLPYDIERIEVLRGPQGTYYGANALGGLIKYVTKDPSLRESQWSTGADLFGIKGSDDLGYVVRVSGNTPLVEDKLAIRASYARDQTPGYLDVPALGRHDVNDSTRQSGNLALSWQPTDRLSVKLFGLVEEIKAADVELVRLDQVTRRPAVGDLQAVSALAQPFEKTVQLYSVTLKYDLGGAQFTSASSFQNARTWARQDATENYGLLVPVLSGGAIASGLTPFDLELDFRKYTQEFRLATPQGERFEGMLGAFFTYEDAPGNQQALAALYPDGTPIAGLSPIFGASIPTRYQEQALFGNLTYKLTDSFDVSAGMRYAENRQKYHSAVIGSFLPNDEFSNRSSESVFNYSLAPRFRFNEDMMVYARVATGYRPGGPNSALSPTTPSEYQSDRITNYELGLKSSLFERSLELNVAAFQIDWQDVQLSLQDRATGTNYNDNGGTARSRGIEWESIYRPDERLRLGLAATYTDAVLTEDLPANSSVPGRDGDRLPGTPRFRGAATVNYNFPIAGEWQGHLGGMYQYVGERHTKSSGDPLDLKLEAYSTVDVNLGASDASWSANLFVRNLTDKRTYSNEGVITNPFTGQIIGVGGTVLQPRTIGLSMDKRF
jgi:outer membrane receptor protein involved in Fe transport